MKCTKIKFKKVDDVRKFVDAASLCDFAIDICQGRMVANAKSILGIINMDISGELTVSYCGNNEQLERVIAQYQIA